MRVPAIASALLEPTNLLLLACALIYALIGEGGEARILLLFVVGISLLDGVQQHRSQRALAELARRVEANLRRALGYTLAIHLPIVTLSLLPLVIPRQPLVLLPVHIALLHLVIDPACTVMFEAMPGRDDLLRQPPRPPEAPLLGPATWRLAMLQGGALVVVFLALAFWPGLALESRRSLVFGQLLLSAGGLVWLNGDRHSRHGVAGFALGVALWLLIQGTPALRGLLLALVVALALAWLPL
jgi:Ca2+-transporting ATPase